jgi:CTP-dependent riboflavin kinase
MLDASARLEPRKLRGKFVKGYGHASRTVEEARPRIGKIMSLGLLRPGTLNVELPDDYQMDNQIIMPRCQVNNVDELYLQRCRVGGLQCVLIRAYPHQPNPGWDSNPPNVLEIMSDACLTEHLRIVLGSAVEVEVEGNEAWWTGASPGCEA